MPARPTYPRRTCVVEGCPSASTQFRGSFICGKHYRLGAPVGSPLRRALIRLRRLHRKMPSRETERRFDLVWRAIIRRAAERGRSGFVDKATVDRLFGWEDGRG